MKRLSLVCALGALTVTLSLGKDPRPSATPTEYSLGMGEPYPTEVDLAYRRLWNFLQHPNNRGRESLKETPFVAVEVSEYQASEVPPAMARIVNGKAQATTYYGSDPTEPAIARMKFLIVFDSRDRRMVGPTGFFVNDTPNVGGIGRFGGITAVYAGTR